MLGEGCHFVDCMRFLAGSPIIRVDAAGHGAAELPIQAWDNLAVTLAFEDRSVATITYVSDGSGKLGKERLELFSGSETAVLDDYQSATFYTPEGINATKPAAQDKGHRAEIVAFLEGVRSGRPPIPLDDLENVTLATLATVESLRTGGPVTITSQ
jgi:predicted dehydrogenase